MCYFCLKKAMELNIHIYILLFPINKVLLFKNDFLLNMRMCEVINLIWDLQYSRQDHDLYITETILSVRNWYFPSYYRERPSWQWSYGGWIYNYLCNQWLSPLMLWIRISIRAMCTALCDNVVSDLRQVCGFLRELGSSPPMKLTATI